MTESGSTSSTRSASTQKRRGKLSGFPGVTFHLPTEAIIQDLAKELGSDPKYLEKLAEDIRKEL
jgi:hypothetical protein